MGVPYSSTLWMFLFHAALCWLVSRRDRKRGEEPVGAVSFNLDVVLASVNTLLLGFVLFLPYHGLRFAGLTDGVILILFIALGCAVVALDQPQFRGTTDRSMQGVSVLWHGFFIGVLALADLPQNIRLAVGALVVISVTAQLLCGWLFLREP